MSAISPAGLGITLLLVLLSVPTTAAPRHPGAQGAIVIGIHAPLTGPAPVREDSFNEGKDLYWEYGRRGRPVTIYGRRVRVVFGDDHFNPSTAKSVCQRLVQVDHAFLLVGFSGPDENAACAEWADSRGVPYLSPGSSRMGLTRLGNYFAISTTYERQSRLLASYIRHVLDVNDAERVALVASDIPAYDGSVEAFTKAFPGVAVYRPSKNENGSSMAANLCLGPTKNYDVVYPLTTPVYYLQMAKAADCGPRYAGVGITMGLDVVASIGCPETRGARFFSPFPAWEDRDRFDPSFDHAVRAARKRQPGFTSDDIVWLLWGASKDVGSLLLEAGKTLTRKRFIATTERATVRTGVWPRLRFAPKDHFGANQVSVLRNACKPRGDADGYYVTQQAFKKSF